MSSLMQQAAREILKQVEISYKEEQKFTDEILLSLHSVYGEVFTRCLDLMENRKFILYNTPKGDRKLIKINGRSEDYTLFYNINYCSCLAFKYQVLKTRNFLTCKHVLAAKLMEITGKLSMESISAELMSELIRNQIPVDL